MDLQKQTNQPGEETSILACSAGDSSLCKNAAMEEMNFGFETLTWLDHVFASLLAPFPFGGFWCLRISCCPEGNETGEFQWPCNLIICITMLLLRYFQCKSLEFGKPGVFCTISANWSIQSRPQDWVLQKSLEETEGRAGCKQLFISSRWTLNLFLSVFLDLNHGNHRAKTALYFPAMFRFWYN